MRGFARFDSRFRGKVKLVWALGTKCEQPPELVSIGSTQSLGSDVKSTRLLVAKCHTNVRGWMPPSAIPSCGLLDTTKVFIPIMTPTMCWVQLHVRTAVLNAAVLLSNFRLSKIPIWQIFQMFSKYFGSNSFEMLVVAVVFKFPTSKTFSSATYRGSMVYTDKKIWNPEAKYLMFTTPISLLRVTLRGLLTITGPSRNS